MGLGTVAVERDGRATVVRHKKNAKRNACGVVCGEGQAREGARVLLGCGEALRICGCVGGDY